MKRQELIDLLVDTLDLHQDDVNIMKATDNGVVLVKFDSLDLEDADEATEKEKDDEDEEDEDLDGLEDAELDDTDLDEGEEKKED